MEPILVPNNFAFAMALSCDFEKGCALQVGATKPIHAKSSQVIQGNVCHLGKVARRAGAEWPMAATAATSAHTLAVPVTVIQSERKSNEAMGIDSRCKILLQQEGKAERKSSQ